MLNKLLNNLPGLYKNYKSGSLLFVILWVLSKTLDDLDAQYNELVKECGVLTARGFWLDFWGFLLSIKRFTAFDETDEDYRKRIFVFLRSNVATREVIRDVIIDFSRFEPVIIEHNGQIIKNIDYNNYELNYDRNIITIEFAPRFTGFTNNVFYIGFSFYGHDTYLRRRSGFYERSIDQIFELLNRVKTAGVKIIMKVGG